MPINVNAGSLTIASSQAVDTSSSQSIDVKEGATLEFDLSSPETLTFSGAISGAGQLRKSGSGELTIAGLNSYSGETRIADGTLRLTTNGQLSQSTLVTVDNSAAAFQVDTNATIGTIAGSGQIGLNSSDLTLASDDSSTFSGQITGDGSLIKSGTGTLTITSDLANAGQRNVQSGRLRDRWCPEQFESCLGCSRCHI